jgi:uncharacterized protein (UPF0332 family)
MNPDDFLKTAEFLNSHSETEANLRTSVSRSYYGIFLHFRDYLLAHGIRKKKEPKKQVHLFVREVFNWSNSRVGSKLAEKLLDLNERRRQADYELGMIVTPEDAIDALEIAQKTISNYSEINNEEEDKLLKNAGAYAQLNWGR